MLHTLPIWFLIAAFFGAGLFNAIGTPATQSSFVRWGYADGGEAMVSSVM